MYDEQPVVATLRREISNGKLWIGRAVVVAFAMGAGLVVVAFGRLSDEALQLFGRFEDAYWWGPLLWTPLATALIVWATRKFAPGAAGSGIPQVMAALDPSTPKVHRQLFVSLKLSLAKVFLTTSGLLAGLSLGREGPSVQIAAGILHSARRWIPTTAQISDSSLLVAGGAAGIAAAFNTPLGGVMFAIEELSKKSGERNISLVVIAIVLAGLVGVSLNGNNSFFGVIRVEQITGALLLPGLVAALITGAAGGLFARLLIVSIGQLSPDRWSRLRARSPIIFAALCGLVVAVIGVVTHGETYGSGYAHNREMLESGADANVFYALLKLVATWLTTWAGVPAGVFAPSLAIGGAIGNDVAQLFAFSSPATIIALGMAGFLAAVTQAPLTAFIIVMEMIDGHAMVLSLMASTLLASGVSRLVTTPLYPALAALQTRRIPSSHEPSGESAPVVRHAEH